MRQGRVRSPSGIRRGASEVGHGYVKGASEVRQRYVRGASRVRQGGRQKYVRSLYARCARALGPGTDAYTLDTSERAQPRARCEL